MRVILYYHFIVLSIGLEFVIVQVLVLIFNVFVVVVVEVFYRCSNNLLYAWSAH